MYNRISVNVTIPTELLQDLIELSHGRNVEEIMFYAIADYVEKIKQKNPDYIAKAQMAALSQQVNHGHGLFKEEMLKNGICEMPPIPEK